jgi:hypothetical protein
MAGNNLYRLPAPVLDGGNPLNSILLQRRHHREFALQPVSLEQVAQLLWAAQGVTSPEGYRTAPSVGALYPLELHLGDTGHPKNESFSALNSTSVFSTN